MDANFIKVKRESEIIKTKEEVIKDYAMISDALNIVGAQKVREYTKTGGAFSIKPDYDKWVRALENAEKIDWYSADNDHDISYDKFTTSKDITDEFKEKMNTLEALPTWYGTSGGDQNIRRAWFSEEDNCVYVIFTASSTMSYGQNGYRIKWGAYLYKINANSTQNLVDLIGEKIINTEQIVRESSAKVLQGAVSTWYNTLRVLALVGLLSVLVYVGIRIIISSTGQEKAKYKNMIKDWLVAICLLFALHYIMAFTMEITEEILKIFSENENVIGENGQDVLMTDIRQDFEVLDNDDEFAVYFSKIIIYIVLVIFTIMFVIQYLKRVVMLAFLTMIAPLITLTYPLDKIKDGQAQAFGIWIKEYVFNALLPVIHMVIYYMLVSSSLQFIEAGNWLYGIVAIGFLLPAERFFRKMFGFEQASSVGQLGAAAGGAMVMNAINKMGHKSGKQASGKIGDSGESGGKTPRFVSNKSENAEGKSADTKKNRSSGMENKSENDSTRVIKDANGNPLGVSGDAFNMNVAGASSKGKMSFGNGAKTLAGKYINRGTGAKVLRAARRGVVGAAGAATLGTVGVAAGVASGDLGKTLQYGAAGAAAGYKGANYLGDKVGQNVETFKEGALGTEEYNTRNSIKELTQDNDFNSVCKELGIENQEQRKALIRQFHSNGITNSQDIKKAMNVRAGNAGTSQNEIIAAQKIRQQAKQDGMKRKEIEESLKAKNLNDDEVKRVMNLIDQL